MKIQFIHLSDLHIKNNTQINMKIDKLVSAVQANGTADKCIVICSGDLAFSGNKREYYQVKSYIGALLSKLGGNKNQLIDFFLVPGNHDILLPSTRNIDEILQQYEKGNENNAFNDELKLQNNFFIYANFKKCFRKNKVIDSHIIDINGYKIQFNLINTAPFSTFKKDNKEIHFLPDSSLYSLIKKDDANLAITVMHHSTEWFHEKTKETLEKLLRGNSDIVFQGHEHSVRAIQNDGYLLSKGGEFSGEMYHKSTFSVLMFNTDTNKCEDIEYEWNDDNAMFCKKSDIRQFIINPKLSFLKPTNKFLNFLYDDINKFSKNVLDYFVFPKLVKIKKITHEEIEILTEDIFWQELIEYKIINISGKSRGGKSTLLKYLYNQCIEKQMQPLYLGSDSYRSKPIDKLLKNIFEDQYGEDSCLYEKYEQSDINKKIILIDDLDMIKSEINQKKLIDSLKNKVAYIIFTSKKRLEIDIKNAVKEEISEEEEYYHIFIEDFYKEKRNELINKICKLNTDKDVTNLHEVIEIIDHLVKRRHGLFELSPEYIAQYVKFFLNKNDESRKGEAIFNVIFETNIRNSIIENTKEKYVEHCLLILEEIAFYIHKNKNEHILFQNIVNIINEININRGLNIDINECLRTVLASKIIKESDDSNIYEFANKNYLAYFIAKKINKLIEKDGLGVPELTYLFKNICFGINDNILLFISFLRDNTKFVLNICIMLEEIINDYIELDFDQNNINFLNRQNISEISISTENDRQEKEKSTDDEERYLREKENEEIQYKSIYDYNEDDANNLFNKIIRAIKYLEIISKSLISQYLNLDLSEKNKIMDLIYKAPNKILYALFKPYDQHYDKIIEELIAIVKSTNNNEVIKKEEIEEIFYDSAITICLNVYNDIAFFGANNETLGLLNTYDLNTTNRKIENLIMEENGGTTNSFVNKAIKLKESENDVFVTSLIRRIVNKHLTSRNIDFNVKDKIADKIFSASSKKQVLAISYKKDKRWE